MPKYDFELMDNLLNGIENSDSKNEMMLNDPAIQAADAVFTGALYKLRGTVPEDVLDEIGEAAISYANAIGTFDLLYGMHVILTIEELAWKPSEMSRHILERVNRLRAS